ncbi:MAG: hypothetical protein ACRYFU_12310 [Janthinobacterium lividum]
MTSVGGVRAMHASSPEEILMDAATLTTLELKAAAADPRERCFLYTELLHNWTELAGRNLASGDDNAAVLAMQHADADAAMLKAALGRDSKRIKNAEQILEHSVHRLSDMVRVTSMDQHDAMQAVLRHISSVHDELLAAVFAH